MLFPLIPAGIAALGAAGRAINSPTGQRFIQGGYQYTSALCKHIK